MLAALIACSLLAPPEGPPLDLPMAGEVTAHSAIVQTRTEPGTSGQFKLMPADPLADASFGETLTADEDRDGLVRERFEGLSPNSSYRYQWTPDEGVPGRIGSFRTLPRPAATQPVDFVVVTGLNYAKFHGSEAFDRAAQAALNNTELPPPAPEAERKLGYPMLEAIQKLDPRFAVFTGDTVYYDTPIQGRAETREEMRAKWHEQFVQPRVRDLLAHVPIFHMKDDHDYRKNDSDNAGDYAPSPELGVDVFREQVPVVPPDDDETPTYRTVRCNEDLQIWLVEGRDYRSPNDMPDGPEKTLWGEEQYDWLTRTLKESDATFKVLVSPTPLVGPDDAYKNDNHTNPEGFRHERGRFFDFLQAEGMLESGEFLILCGDRHWQYHATHPSGVQEFSSGAVHRSNARGGRVAGDPKSTDPEGKIVQHYLMGRDAEPSGGFLYVRVQREQGVPTLALRHLVSVDGGVATKTAYETEHRLKKDRP